mgnify:CR=1 FL=1
MRALLALATLILATPVLARASTAPGVALPELPDTTAVADPAGGPRHEDLEVLHGG